MTLGDGILVKDNHIRVAHGIANAVKQVRAWGAKHPVEVEVTTLLHDPRKIAAAIGGAIASQFRWPDRTFIH